MPPLPGVDSQDGASFVVLTGEHQQQLALLGLGEDGGAFLRELVCQRGVVSLYGHAQQFDGGAHAGLETAPPVDGGAQTREALHDGLRVFGIVPEIRRGCLLL